MTGKVTSRLSARISEKMEAQSSQLAASTDTAMQNFTARLSDILKAAEHTIEADITKVTRLSSRAVSRTIWRLEWLTMSSPLATGTVALVMTGLICGAILWTANEAMKTANARQLNAFGASIYQDATGAWLLMSPDTKLQTCKIGGNPVICIHSEGQ